MEVPVLEFESSVQDSSIININSNSNDNLSIDGLLNQLNNIKMKHDDKNNIFRILSAITKHTFKFEMIEHKKSYPIKSIEDETFVIIDDLDLMYDL